MSDLTTPWFRHNQSPVRIGAYRATFSKEGNPGGWGMAYWDGNKWCDLPSEGSGRVWGVGAKLSRWQGKLSPAQ